MIEMTLETESVGLDYIVEFFKSIDVIFSNRTVDAKDAVRLFIEGYLVILMIDIAELRRDGTNGLFPMTIVGVEKDDFGKLVTVHLLDITGNLGYDGNAEIGFKIFERSVVGTPDNALVSDSVIWRMDNGKK